MQTYHRIAYCIFTLQVFCHTFYTQLRLDFKAAEVIIKWRHTALCLWKLFKAELHFVTILNYTARKIQYKCYYFALFIIQFDTPIYFFTVRAILKRIWKSIRVSVGRVLKNVAFCYYMTIYIYKYLRLAIIPGPNNMGLYRFAIFQCTNLSRVDVTKLTGS